MKLARVFMYFLSYVKLHRIFSSFLVFEYIQFNCLLAREIMCGIVMSYG
jgi:hypothetical protein